MDAHRAKHYEALILGERDRCLEMLHQLESEEAEPQSASGGDTVRGQKKMADAASDTLEQETDFASASRLSELLTDLDEALDLILERPDRYGICQECGEAIAARRLELVPWTARCSSCVRLADRLSTP